MWQDYVFLAGGIIFIFALFPSLFSKDKPNWMTSISTSFFLYCYATAFFSLNLKYAAITTVVTATIWLILYIQKIGGSKC